MGDNTYVPYDNEQPAAVAAPSVKQGYLDVYKRQVYLILSGILAILAFVPGLPTLPLLAVALIGAALGFVLRRAQKQPEPVTEPDVAEEAAKEKRKPENVTSLLRCV